MFLRVHEYLCARACVCVCAITYLSIQAGAKQSILKRSLTEFLISKTDCHNMVKELTLPYYLPLSRGRIVGCALFKREMQPIYYAKCSLSKIWTLGTMAISNYGYLYITEPHTHTHTYIYIYIYIYICIYTVIHRQTISLYLYSLVWIDTRDAWSWDRNLVDFMPVGYLIRQPSAIVA